MRMCYNCLKTSDLGHLVSHAKNKVNHERKANLHRAHVMFNGVKTKVLLCSKCMRTVERAHQVAK